MSIQTENQCGLNYALAYLSLGWPVFPIWPLTADGICSCYLGNKCPDPGKHPWTPAVPHGSKNATTNPGVAESWWCENPEAGIAVNTGVVSGIVALDVDSRNGGDESLAKLIAEHGPLPDNVAVYTTRHGDLRYLFRCPPEGLRTRDLAPGLELKADRGGIILPPTQGYSWPFPGTPPTWDLPLPPDWVRARNGRGPAPPVPPQITSNRKTTLVSIAGSLVAKGIGPEGVEAAVRAVNESQTNNNPLPEEEIRDVLRSASKWEPGKLPAEGEQLRMGASPWPEPPAADAFYGLAGDIVRDIEPQTEADPPALLLSLLAAVGSTIGDKPHCIVGADKHPARLFVTLVGPTGVGRKGQSWSRVRQIINAATLDTAIEEGISPPEITTGLSSGEGVLWAVRDAIHERKSHRDKGEWKHDDVEVDPGVSDKRLLIVEPEFARVLRVMGREGNPLSAILRQAWDSGDLRVLNKNAPVRVTGAHLCIIGHITKEELRRHLDSTEAASGFGNRFLWVASRRSKLLPEGGDNALNTLNTRRLTQVFQAAASIERAERSPEAKALWAEVYPRLTKGSPGLFGAVTSRAEAQVLRLSLLYALLDKSAVIEMAHLKAALAVWDYCARSARWIFGDATGDSVADKILRALRDDKNKEGLTDKQIYEDVLQKHVPAERKDQALTLLEEAGLIEQHQRATGGRTATAWEARG